MSLCVADIMMPEQEKVWPRLSDPPECCSSGVQPETSLFVCILVWHVIWFHLFIFIYNTLITFMALHLVPVLFLCLNYVLFNSGIALVKLRTGTTFSLSFASFFPVFLLLCQLNGLFLSRYQPGLAALSGYQDDWSRVWRRLCPEHQPWLLTTSLRVCQRTGTRTR